ncbi:MAG: NUDIX domain-containing protein [Acidobacteriota bacterium]
MTTVPPRSRREDAAGAVVIDGGGQILLLRREWYESRRRHQQVTLPLVHLKPGEDDADAALRGVRERSGLDDLQLLADLGASVVHHLDNEVPYTCREHYFLVRSWTMVKTAKAPAPWTSEACSDLDSAASKLEQEEQQAAVLRARAWVT